MSKLDDEVGYQLCFVAWQRAVRETSGKKTGVSENRGLGGDETFPAIRCDSTAVAVISAAISIRRMWALILSKRSYWFCCPVLIGRQRRFFRRQRHRQGDLRPGIEEVALHRAACAVDLPGGTDRGRGESWKPACGNNFVFCTGYQMLQGTPQECPPTPVARRKKA